MRWRPRKLLAWGLGSLLALLFAGVLIVGAAIGWTLHTTGGAAWVVARVPGLGVTGLRGVLGGEFTAERIELALPDGSRIVLLDAGWRDPSLQWAPGAPHGWRLRLQSLHARQVDVIAGPPKTPPSPSPLKRPSTLRLPVSAAIDQLNIGALRIAPATQPLLRDLQAHGLVLGDDAGSRHRLDGLQVTIDRWRFAANAEVMSDAPFALKVDADITQPATESMPAWQGRIALKGTLEATELELNAQLHPQADRTPASLAVRGQLQPFAGWPLKTLSAQARALDLSALLRDAPVTSLTGQAQLDTQARDRPARITAELSNDAAGRWDSGRVPVRRLAIELQARPDELSTLHVRRLALQLGTQQAAAGTLQGLGNWTKNGWSFEASVTGMQPALLDARAPAMTLSGPISATGPAQGIVENGVAVRTRLSGSFSGSGPLRSAQLALQAHAARDRVEVQALHAEAGGSRLDAKGVARRSAAEAPWQVQGNATLADFDPARWWPGSGPSPWREGPNRLNARLDADLRAGVRPVSLQGHATFVIAPSVLAGVPLSGEATWQSARSGADATLKFSAAGNALNASGRWSHPPASLRALLAIDQWTANLEAPTLSRLDPWWKAVAPQAAQGTLAGSLQAELTVEGRWPAVSGSGRLSGGALSAGGYSVQRVQAKWQVDARPGKNDAPVLIDATLEKAAGAGRALFASASVALDGSLQSHRLHADAVLPQAPPPWLVSKEGKPAPTGSRATLQAEGRLLPGPARNSASWSGWQGRLREAAWGDVRTADNAAWARVRDVDLSVHWSDGLQAEVAPGRADLFGAGLRWERIAWDSNAKGNTPRLALQAVLEPLAIAPWLDRLQPRVGWRGDLTVGGRVTVQSHPSPSIDVLLQRERGDLHVTDESGGRVHALGLSELRIGLQLRDGRWSFSEAVAGEALGSSSGSLQARLPAGAWWPANDTALDGSFALQVAQMSAWNPWLPAGWRLGGKLQAELRVAGRYETPALTGRITGNSLAVRQTLQGIDLRDGELVITLEGGRARIDRFDARGGDGKVELSGEAFFGDTPSAQLTMRADRLLLLGRSDRRIVTSGQARLQLDRDTVVLDGGFTVDEGLIDIGRSDAPKMPDDVEVVRPGTEAASRTVDGMRRAVQLALDIDLGQHLQLRGAGVNTGLRGKLHLALPDGKLAITGSVQTASGRYDAYGQRLVIDRGVITFTGPPDNPRLDVEATRPNLDVRVGVHISGTAQAPRLRLFSEPEMAEMEKLSWLILGRSNDGNDANDAALLQRVAIEVLAERTGTAGAVKSLGLDELSMTKPDGATGDSVLALGKQLSQRWFLRYERGANEAAGNWQVIYRAARHFTVRAQAGEDSAVDVIWTWRWQ